MAVQLDEVRMLALGLPDTAEEPHHDFGSFRPRGKIFVTIPPGGEFAHIFLPDHEREVALAINPESLEPVPWGSKVLGVRARLRLARKATVLERVRKACTYKAAVAPRSSKPPPRRRRGPENAA